MFPLNVTNQYAQFTSYAHFKKKHIKNIIDFFHMILNFNYAHFTYHVFVKLQNCVFISNIRHMNVYQCLRKSKQENKISYYYYRLVFLLN